MDLKDFLKSHPYIQIAESRDNDEVLDFFSSSQIQAGKIEMFYDRFPDFFAFLKLHSEDHYVFILRNPGGPIQGLGTLLFRDAYIDGKVVRICYLGDLRVTLNRIAALQWRNFYGDIFAHRRNIAEFRDIEKFYTCLMNDNQRSQKNLVGNRKSAFSYHSVCPYSMQMLLLKKPGEPATTSWTVESPASISELLPFYKQHESSVEAGYVFSEEIPRRLRIWPNLSEKSFLQVRNGDEILATCALWSPSSAKRILISQIPRSLKAFFVLTRFLTFGRSRFEGELKVLYLTHVLFKADLPDKSREQALELLLHRAWRVRGRLGFHFLSFSDFTRRPLKKAARGFFVREVPMSLHEVTGRDEPIPRQHDTYGFEMALV